MVGSSAKDLVLDNVVTMTVGIKRALFEACFGIKFHVVYYFQKSCKLIIVGHNKMSFGDWFFVSNYVILVGRDNFQRLVC